MIPRTLVPVNVRPVDKDEAKKAPRRLSTYMDDRTVVPSELSDAPPLNGNTSIPAHFPLGVLVNRTLVPRGMPVKAIERSGPITESVPIAILDSRVVVPAYVEPATPQEIRDYEHAPEMTDELREIIQPDIFTTGDANLLIEPEEKRDAKSDLVTRILSVAVHIALIVFLIFSPKIFPAHVPTQEEIDLAKKALNFVYLPPEVSEPPAPTPKIHVDRNTLNKIAPPVTQPQIPAPPVNPERAPSDLPEAPRPQIPVTSAPAPSQPMQPTPSHLEPVLPASPQNRLNLQLPQSSPGKSISDQITDAIRTGRKPGTVYGGGPVAPGGGGPGMGYGVQVLSDTQGVDFNPYIQRLLASLKRNWEAVMPESARMGDRGVVFTTFQVNPDGSVPSPDPELERTSGKEPLDNAAMSAIHASNPFEPLPPQFHGPYLKLRIAFIYNIPPEQVNLH
ncbi:MAG TPA: TonB C-terminal domain-containing protein [Candidatus Acidoferrales bacterium]|nr:TonB C-terminal domain-containing protein [Candidatus Acidoferrales bacterium]